MGSTRLPGKVMKIIDTKNPSLQYTINQLKTCKTLNKIIVATTNLPEDDIIENYLQKIGVNVFRGSSDDVLDRYFKCAKHYGLSDIVRVTADCPLIDPNTVDTGVQLFQSQTYDYVTNTFPRTFPDGNETEIFSINALEKIWKNAKLPSEREHVSPYMMKNPDEFRQFHLRNPIKIPPLRLTIDKEEDLELCRNIISKISKHPILLHDILELYGNEPKLFEINIHIDPLEGYNKSINEDGKL